MNPSSEDNKFVAPCGLYCLNPRCPILKSPDGEKTRALARSLSDRIAASNYADALAAWKSYKNFEKMLKILSEKAGTCEGCGSTSPCYSNCQVRKCCLQKRGLRFCSQCPELPCKKLAMLDKGNLGRCLRNFGGIKTLGLEKWLKTMKPKNSRTKSTPV